MHVLMLIIICGQGYSIDCTIDRSLVTANVCKQVQQQVKEIFSKQSGNGYVICVPNTY